MLDSKWMHLIEEHILKRGEVLESASHVSSDPSSPLLDIAIVKRTARTFRRLGMLTVSRKAVDGAGDDLGAPHRTLLRWSPGKKADLPEDETTFRWLEQGWIMKELRFNKDGRTVDSQSYRMGYELFRYQRQTEEAAEYALNQAFASFKEEASIRLSSPTPYSVQREQRLQTLIHRLHEICEYSDVNQLQTTNRFPQGWTVPTKLQFLTFALAFIHLAAQKELYDWKEIGAAYFQKIGGSKSFDAHKDEFIALIEDWAGCPVAMLGLVSLGKITPLYFSGQLTGRCSSYQWGPVHALTDLSIAQEAYKTTADTLWLVENRAILTRLAYEDAFLSKTSSLIACVDGHLRSSHKAFIQQVLNNSSISQVIIWSDYDEAGLQIAQGLYQEVATYAVKTKWIRHDQHVETRWDEYKAYAEELIEGVQIEQEQVLGSVEIWNQWISL